MSSTWLTARAWLLMLPLLIVMVGVIGWPLAETLRLSFTDAKLVGSGGDFVGFANYTKALTGAAFQKTLWTTLWFAVASVSIEFTDFWVGRYATVDNLTVGASAVPEPGQWALMAAGLAALGMLKRRRAA